MAPKVSSVWVKRDLKAKEPPGLSYAGCQRAFGQVPKTIPARLQPPELDTDSIMTEKNNPTQEQKIGEQQARPTVNIAENTQEMQT